MRRRAAPKSVLAGSSAPGRPRADRVDLPVLLADDMPDGVVLVKRYRSTGDLVECLHDEAWRTGSRCGWCHGEERLTDGFTLAVKRIAKVVGEPVPQGSLF